VEYSSQASRNRRTGAVSRQCGYIGRRVEGVSFAPAVLPALRRIRIVDSQLDPQYYAAIGDPPARRIVRLPSSTEDDVSAEKEIQDMSRGLLRLLRGLGTNLSKKEKQADDGMVPWMILTYLYASGSRCSRQRRVSGLTAHIAT
jgi:hypothetical protein